MVKKLNKSIESLESNKNKFKPENSKAINKFSKLMNTSNKLEEKLENFKKERILQSKIQDVFSLYQNIIKEDECTEEINENCEINIMKNYANYAKKMIIGEKFKSLNEMMLTIQEKKKETTEFCTSQINYLVKEVSVFKDLDSSRLLFLLRKIRKLKDMVIEVLLEKEISAC